MMLGVVFKVVTVRGTITTALKCPPTTDELLTIGMQFKTF